MALPLRPGRRTGPLRELLRLLLCATLELSPGNRAVLHLEPTQFGAQPSPVPPKRVSVSVTGLRSRDSVLSLQPPQHCQDDLAGYWRP